MSDDYREGDNKFTGRSGKWRLTCHRLSRARMIKRPSMTPEVLAFFVESGTSKVHLATGRAKSCYFVEIRHLLRLMTRVISGANSPMKLIPIPMGTWVITP